MSSVFRKQTTRAVPVNAIITTGKGGQRIAKFRVGSKLRTAPVTVSADGTERIVTESSTYYAKYRDGEGVVQTVPTGCRDERNAQAKLVELERQAELVKAGVLKPQEVKHGKERQRPLEDHLVGYTDHLLAKGVTEPHRVNTLRCLRRLMADCKWTTLADLRRESLENWLALRTAERMSARSRNAHHTALVSFVNWALTVERMDRNPFFRMAKADEKANPRRKRRALTEAELTRLLAVAQTRPLREAQTVRRGKNTGQQLANIRPEVQEQLLRLGRERALMYKMMVLTGLRQNELATLSVGQLELEQAVAVAVLDAADEKNREGNDVPLRADLVADLRAWLAEQLRLIQADARRAGLPVPLRLATDRLLFTVPKQLVRILNRDLALAGIPKADERGRTVDVHALRHTFGTLLSKGGVTPRTAQAAMRHSSIDLTMNVYTDPKLLDVCGALDALPALPINPMATSLGATTATG